jgi:hypothetical protein
MSKQPKCGFLILDRKGEYIEDTKDQRLNTVFGLQNHRKARERMVVVSMRPNFDQMKTDGVICDYLHPKFNISDIRPIDLADFLPGLTDTQAELIRDYAHVKGFYEKLLGETQFGGVDNRHWFQSFPGLFDLKDKGKKLLKKFEETAKETQREELSDEERCELQDEVKGGKQDVLERAAACIKRFCLNPFFGGSAKGRTILAAPSCVDKILEYLAEKKFVFIDMRKVPDVEYIMVAALMARKIISENKDREDKNQIQTCIVMEEVQNILNDDQLSKGGGKGSVFIELAREGRSYKLGFVLVTQQPDAKSIAPQIAKTIDVVTVFNVPPEDAKHLHRLKSAFEGMEQEISNAPVFQGVAVSDGGPVFFESGPVDLPYMQLCDASSVEEHIKAKGASTSGTPEDRVEESAPPSVEDRLAALMRKRQESIQSIALDTIQVWRGRRDTPGDNEE